MKLSILIPVYNFKIKKLVLELHEQAVKLQETYEILIADDCSTDTECIKEYDFCRQLNHCQVFRFHVNKGRTFTRNFLAQKAQANHLLFLDADVMPKNPNFLRHYLEHSGSADLIFGGITYSEKTPEKQQILRWKYGKAREAKSVEKRKENPYYTIISQAFLIDKDIFLKVNQSLENKYGMDSIFTSNLLKNKAKILHIDNPIIHYGLESADKFIEKTKSGLQTLIELEQQNLVAENYRPVQTAYRKLATFKLLHLYQKGYQFIQHKIDKNLLSNNPSLFYFDLYKLNYYTKLKDKL